MSDDLGLLTIKPKAGETKTEELAKLTITGMEYYESIEFRNKIRGKRTRTVSSPDNTLMLRKMLENIRLEEGRNQSND